MDSDEWNPTFGGTRALRVRRRLGQGGMGVVYEADDVERGTRVAVKTLVHRSAEEVYRLKREFRTLADLSHPNLITLFDLVSEGDTTFFTMELVDGDDFLSYVRGIRTPDDPSVSAHEPTMLAASSGSAPAQAIAMGASAALDHTLPGGMACDESKLRKALVELALGLVALHEAGIVHRDVKPSNVMVTKHGRVVILDFGLASARAEGAGGEGLIVGTARYMAPEQAAGGTATPASDWYAVGALLFEALTGRPAFEGTVSEVLDAKLRNIPVPAVRACAPNAPNDLSDLCADLCSVSSARRPRGHDVLERLGAKASASRAPPSSLAMSGTERFVGRERELQALLDGCARVDEGRPTVALVSGASGIGKSALVGELVKRLGARGGVVVLEGRCYPQEYVPFKAFDGLVDHLSNYWMRLDDAGQRELLPRHAGILPRLFPVLERVPVVATAPRVEDVPDLQEMRTRAFAALRELLSRIGDRRSLVIILDDLQWVDADTVALLADVARPPEPPRAFFVLCARDEGREGLEAIARRMAAEPITVALEPLSVEESERFAAGLLGGESGRVAKHVALESGGSPFFLAEIARYVRTAAPDDSGAPRSFDLDRVLRRRIAELPDQARGVLELVAVAGEPIARDLVREASGLSSDELEATLRVLRTAQVVRVASGASEERVEPYHDRIRLAVRAGLSVGRRRSMHLTLAEAIGPTGDAESLARHFSGAGDRRRAADHAERAAEDARRALNFDRAAALYRMALDLGEHDAALRRELLIAHGEALEHAGRAAEAAEIYTEASRSSDEREQLDLRRRAAVQFLRSGHLEKGFEVLAVVLAEFGLRLAKTPLRAILTIVLYTILIRLRGLRVRLRPESSVDRRELMRVDTLGTVAVALMPVDPGRASALRVQYTLAAMRTRERSRVAKALMLESVGASLQGAGRRARMLSRRARELATATEDPWTFAGAQGSDGFADFIADSAWRRAAARFDEVEEFLRQSHQSAGWEIDTAQLFALMARFYLGELDGVRARLPNYLAEAERRGDRYAQVTLRTRLNVVYLVTDDTARAEKELEDAIGMWVPSADSIHVQHFLSWVARTEVALYAGRLDRASELAVEWVPRISRSLIMQLPLTLLEARFLRGRLALAQAVAVGAEDVARQTAHVREAQRMARGLARMRLPVARAWGTLLRAGVAAVTRDPVGCEAHLREAIAAYSALEMPLFRAASELRLGASLDSRGGARLRESATSTLVDAGVKSPDRFAALFAPGWR